MGRSCVSVRLGVRSLAERWEMVAKRMDQKNKAPAEQLIHLAKRHSSEAFFGCDNPLEAMIFSALVEMGQSQEIIDAIVDP